MPKLESTKHEETENIFKDGVRYSILEEGIDVSTQRSFMLLRDKLTSNRELFRSICRESEQNREILFDKNTPAAIVKKMLVSLSTLDSVPVFRTLQRFSATETPLQKWGIIAAQQSRMVITTSIMGQDAGIFVSSGLGGKDNRLRYFCAIGYNCTDILEPYQEELLYNEMKYTICEKNGEVENFTISGHYAAVTVLLPLKADIKNIFAGIIHECNKYGNFLDRHAVITNVKILTKEEILKQLGIYETA